MVQLDIHAAVMLFNGSRFSLVCLLLLERLTFLLYGALAISYIHEHGRYEDQYPVLDRPEIYPGHNMDSNDQPSTSSSKNLISPSSNEMRLPEGTQMPGGRSASLYSQLKFLHPSKYPKIAQTNTVSAKGERTLKESKQNTNAMGSQYARFRNAPGGFNPNALGSLYPSKPSQTKVSVPVVYTVPYSSINGKYSADDQLQSNHLDQQSYVEPERSSRVSSMINLQYPSQSLVGLQDRTGTPSASPASLEGSLTYIVPNTLHHRRRSRKMALGQGTQSSDIRPSQRFVSSNSVPVGISLGSLSWTTTTGPGLDFHPVTENLPSQNSQPERSVVASSIPESGSTRGEGVRQSFEKGHKVRNGPKQASQIQPKTRYLVSAFNHYEQGRIYRSHSSNDPTEVDFPFGDEMQQLQAQSDGNSQRKI